MRTMRVLAAAVLVAFVLGAAAGCISDDATLAALEDRAIAVMKGADGADMGTVTFTQGPRGVLVSADVKGLSEGWHGFHVHEAGDCSPDFGAAGGHFAPNAKGHGFMHSGWRDIRAICRTSTRARTVRRGRTTSTRPSRFRRATATCSTRTAPPSSFTRSRIATGKTRRRGIGRLAG